MCLRQDSLIPLYAGFEFRNVLPNWLPPKTKEPSLLSNLTHRSGVKNIFILFQKTFVQNLKLACQFDFCTNIQHYQQHLHILQQKTIKNIHRKKEMVIRIWNISIAYSKKLVRPVLHYSAYTQIHESKMEKLMVS